MSNGDEPVDPTRTGSGSSLNNADENGDNLSVSNDKHWLDYANFWTSVVVLLVAVAGFALTISQIGKAADQIEGATLYQLGKDGRELMRDQRSGKALPVDILSYFHSAYLLHERGVVDEAGWIPLRKAYCRYIQASEPARKYLETYRSLYDTSFNTFSMRYEEGEECA